MKPIEQARADLNAAEAAECDVCGGARTIMLPVRRQMLACHAMDAEARIGFDDKLERMQREYPCPECMDSAVPFERLLVVKGDRFAAHHLPDGYLDHVKKACAQAMIAKLIESGAFRFEIIDGDGPGHRQVRGTLGVVAPRHVARLDERVQARQFDVADEAIAEAISQVNNWGSEYRVPTVQKEQAGHLLREALAKVKRRFTGG